MRRIFPFICFISLFGLADAQTDGQACDLELNYNVNYKWGFVNVDIGEAIVNINIDQEGQLNGTINGHTIPWGGCIYSVADTLQSQMAPESQKIIYINGYYRKPKADSDPNLDNPDQYRTILDQGSLNASSSTMEAIDITAQMIGLYYYARNIQFDNQQPGHTTIIPIEMPDGSRQELSVLYHGKKPGYSGGESQVYDTTINYTYHGQLTSYPIRCQIDTETLLPTFFAANIHIGHVQMELRAQQ